MDLTAIKAFAEADLDKLCSRLLLDEKIALLGGQDWWTTASAARLGVPALRVSDGPNGVRGKSHFRPTPATCIPCATCLGSTFDQDLLNQAGALLATECAAKGSSVLLAPTINIQRNPLHGRAYESFSEDPFLSGTLAKKYIEGLQDNGIGACVKHFVGNDMEHERFAVDVVIPERALREIYLMPFMIALQAKPWTVMTSYSRVNGTHVSEDHRLLTRILREEWKYDGLTMSDWTGTYSTSESTNAGLDLEMPGPAIWRGGLLKAAINAGKVDVSRVNESARRVLQLLQRAAKHRPELLADLSAPERTVNTEESRATNRKLASSGIVLLKNDRNVLPLRSIKTLAILGPNAKTRTVSGGGSAYLTSNYVVTPYEGLLSAAAEQGIKVEYSAGCYAYKYLPMLDGWMKTAAGDSGWSASFYNDDPLQGGDLLETLVLPGSRLRIRDEKPKGLAERFYVTMEAYLLAPSTGAFEFGMTVAGGRASLSIDEHEIIDNGIKKKQVPGTSFYGLGTVEETGVVHFEQGKTYKLNIYFSTVMTEMQDFRPGQPNLMMAALRVGCAPKLDEDRAVQDAVELAKSCDAVVVVTGNNMDIEAEASDRTDLFLPGKTNEFVEAILAAKPDAVIVNQSGSAVSFPWIDKASAVVQSWFGGNETGNAIADILFGKVNPSGRLPISFPHKIEHCTGHLNWQSESGRVSYGEGIFVGYRGYDETDRDPMFAFGHGLSYTSFEWSPIQAHLLESPEITIYVKVDITNNGKVAGAEVVQIYVTDPECSYRRPRKELKGYKKVFVDPGETKTVEISLDRHALGFYNDKKACWVAEKGRFLIHAARSAKAGAIESTMEVILESTSLWCA